MSTGRNTLPVEKDARCCKGPVVSRDSGSSSLAYSLPLALACMLLVAISLCSMFVVRTAEAATWPVSTSGLSASVMFRQTYSTGGKSYVHSGIDVPASAGMQISTPLAGTVRFTGAVPSGDSRTGGGSSEKTMKAVSIEVEGGRVITLMPFSSIDVAEGEVVAEGSRLGTLASSGDASSAEAHVHMGYKNGRTYLDPMQLFAAAASSGGGTGADARDAMSVAVPTSSYGNALGQDAALFVPDVLALGASEPDLVPDSAPDSAPESFGTIESGEYVLRPREKRAPSPLEPIVCALQALGNACSEQGEAFVEALSALSRGTGIPVVVLLGSLLVLAALSAIVLGLLALRLAMPRIRVMWRNLKRHLFTCAGGDSMHKLFPASGAAFMSRSRIARGR